LIKTEYELENLSLETYPKMYKKYTRKSTFGNWTTKIGPIENKLKDKNYRCHGKSCPRIKNHANGTEMCCAIFMIFYFWA
jgi:hypothetical protein